MKFYKKNHIRIVLVLIIAGIAVWLYQRSIYIDEDSISSFQDCVDAGFPVMESYPEQCRTRGGKNFVRKISKEVSISGIAICLPHKGDGPHTMECAFGIEDDTGINYQVGLSEGGEFDFIMGEKYEISGTFTSQPESQYDILGVVEVENLKKLE